MFVIYFFKNFWIKRIIKKFDLIPKTNKEDIPVTYGCIRPIDS